MFTLVYASTATKRFSSEELLELLRHPREKNVTRDITGLLLYKQGAFMQALEGEEAAVRALYVRICNDPCHHDLITLVATPITQRQFADWSMGFENLNGWDVSSTPGYNPRPLLPPPDEDLSLASVRRTRPACHFPPEGCILAVAG